MKFKEAAQFEINEQNLAEAEAEKQKSLIDRIPVAIRKCYGLPASTADLEVLKKNAQKHAATIVELVQAAQLAWVASAEIFNEGKHWSLDEEFIHGSGLLRLLNVSELPDELLQARIQSVLDARGQSDDEAPEPLSDEATDVKQDALLSLFTEAAAAHCLQVGHEFCSQHPDGEPTVAAIRALLGEMPPESLCFLVFPCVSVDKCNVEKFNVESVRLGFLGFPCVSLCFR